MSSCPPPDNNLPAKVPDPNPQDDAINEVLRRKQMAALAESALKFRRSAQDAMDDLIVGMIHDQIDIGWIKFHTPNGRNCVLALGVGDDAVGPMTDALYNISHPEEGNNEEPKDSRE